MKRIKKFESFTTTHRMPTEISYDEWSKKFEIHDREPFEEKEKDFFRKLSENNSDVDDDVHIMDYYISLIIYNGGIRQSVKINKLSDSWYLIQNVARHIDGYIQEYYI